MAPSFAELDEVDFEQWQLVSPVERLKAVWSLVEDAMALSSEHGTLPRLDRAVGGVRPLRA